MKTPIWVYGLLLLGAAGLVGVLIGSGRPTPRMEPTPTPYQATALFPTLFDNPESIIGFELLFPESSMGIAVVYDDEQEIWRERDAPFRPIVAEQADELRIGIARLPTYGQIQQDDQPTETYDLLLKAQTVVRFQVAQNLEVISLYLRGTTSDRAAYYVSFEPESVIFSLIPTEWLDTLVAAILTLQPLEAGLMPSASATP